MWLRIKYSGKETSLIKIGSLLNIYLIKYLIEQRKKEEEASIKKRKMILLRLI